MNRHKKKKEDGQQEKKTTLQMEIKSKSSQTSVTYLPSKHSVSANYISNIVSLKERKYNKISTPVVPQFSQANRKS